MYKHMQFIVNDLQPSVSDILTFSVGYSLEQLVNIRCKGKMCQVVFLNVNLPTNYRFKN